MNAIQQVTTLVRWALIREARRRETIVNMTLFAVLILFAGRLGVETFARSFIVDVGLPPEKQGQLAEEASHSMGPIFFWIAALFAGTVGLNHSFAAEREGDSLGGIVTAPIDLGVYDDVVDARAHGEIVDARLPIGGAVGRVVVASDEV